MLNIFKKIKEQDKKIEELIRRIETLEEPIRKAKEEQDKKIESLKKLMDYNVDMAMQKVGK